MSKLFASFGDHSKYHLNESALYTTWLQGLGDGGLLYKAGALPSVKGSRQMITVELANYVALNRRGFLKYLRQNSANKRLEGGKVRDANQLIKCAVAGLEDHFIVCGILSRAIFFVGIGNLARYVLNALANRHNLRRIMDEVNLAIDEMFVDGFLIQDGHLALRLRLVRRYPIWHSKTSG